LGAKGEYLPLDKGEFSELYKFTLIPLLLGFSSAIAIIVMVQLYHLFDYIFKVALEFSWHLVIVLPLLGLLSSYMLNRYLAGYVSGGCGTDLMIETYHHRNGVIEIKDVLIKTLSSTITLGFGGSGGLEGPGLLLGGGVASFILQKLKLKPRDLKLLYLCGAAAGFTALFKAPLTGILLALEIPYRRDIEKDAFIPAALSSVSAYIFSAIFFGGERIFPTQQNLVVSTGLLAHAILLGIASSITALAFIKFLEKAKVFSERLASKTSLLVPIAAGGISIGVIGFFYPQVLGVGYDTISKLAGAEDNGMAIQTLAAILVLKILATSLTVSSGGSVGLFIPALYVGGVCGLIYAKALGLHPASVYALIAMGSIVAAATKSLLTGIAFVAETVGAGPIMFTVLSASISYFLTGKKSFYESQLNKKPSTKVEALLELEEIFKKSRESLQNLNASSVKFRKPVYFTASMPVRDALKIIRTNVYRTYPIIDDKGQVVGSIDIETLFAIGKEKWNIPVSELEVKRPLLVVRDQPLIKVIEEMLESGEEHAFVVDSMQNNSLIGVITASDIIRVLVEKI